MNLKITFNYTYIILYLGCPVDHENASKRWCSTKVDSKRNHVVNQNEFGYCADNCPVQNAQTNNNQGSTNNNYGNTNNNYGNTNNNNGNTNNNNGNSNNNYGNTNNNYGNNNPSNNPSNL